MARFPGATQPTKPPVAPVGTATGRVPAAAPAAAPPAIPPLAAPATTGTAAPPPPPLPAAQTTGAATPPPVSTAAGLPAVIPPPAPMDLEAAPSADDLLADAGDRDQVGREDLAIPFIGVVQSLSPVRQAGDPAYIAGAEEGDIYNTVTRELFKKAAGVKVIPVMFRKLYLEWVPRKEGGGFRGSHQTREETGATLDKATGKWITPEGNEIIDTAEHYVLVESLDGTWSPALISMTSTKLKVSRQWNTRMQMVKIPGTQITPASYAKAYQLTTVVQKNDKGTFYNFAIAEIPGFVMKPLYEMAKGFRASLLAGEVKTDYSKADDVPDGAAEAAAPETPGGATF